MSKLCNLRKTQYCKIFRIGCSSMMVVKIVTALWLMFLAVTQIAIDLVWTFHHCWLSVELNLLEWNICVVFYFSKFVFKMCGGFGFYDGWCDQVDAGLLFKECKRPNVSSNRDSWLVSVFCKICTATQLICVKICICKLEYSTPKFIQICKVVVCLK